MEYIVFDLEFNQGFDKTLNKTVSNERCPFEIIQIGAIKLDSNFNIIDTFNSYVKPEIYKGIHPFIGKMTGITLKDVADAPSFPQAYKEFKRFISSKDPVLCVWGTGDLKELYRNITYYNLPSKTLPKSYINIQHYASIYFDNPAGRSIGLQNAIQILELNQDKSYHNALNDAFYTAQVFIRIYNPSIVPDVYIYTTVKSSTVEKSTKKQINYDRLFEEFSKVLNRELSKEDKKIIDLAYKMGKTNQFLINSNKCKKR
ncbi:3'-5' exonuclease [Romboutsia sedimentorum]|uniref:3'-5' exonuclease n=1 Tax=Romboutsia sedimentorum TaxID=1368474 RepID=A0ABT7E8T7_9FIRM|nr:3'-5' exonuclease [Romboutsia sedimentorum]MDK2563339.1 3'-5' exonuclease [Romboutsia sedimentorum]MDK2585063.1 3'-5' exonuclease [Romboutsia sedimentorum]